MAETEKISVVQADLRNQSHAEGFLKLMDAYAEEIAKDLGCCKLTLEVLSGNEKAKAAYLRFGFDGYQLAPETGHALFWQKKLE